MVSGSVAAAASGAETAASASPPYTISHGEDGEVKELQMSLEAYDGDLLSTTSSTPSSTSHSPRNLRNLIKKNKPFLEADLAPPAITVSSSADEISHNLLQMQVHEDTAIAPIVEEEDDESMDLDRNTLIGHQQQRATSSSVRQKHEGGKKSKLSTNIGSLTTSKSFTETQTSSKSTGHTLKSTGSLIGRKLFLKKRHKSTKSGNEQKRAFNKDATITMTTADSVSSNDDDDDHGEEQHNKSPQLKTKGAAHGGGEVGDGGGGNNSKANCNNLIASLLRTTTL